jgi:regulatory protein
MNSPMTSCPPQSTSEARQEQAHALCLRLLTVRARTRAELAGQLAKRGYPEEAAEAALSIVVTPLRRMA